MRIGQSGGDDAPAGLEHARARRDRGACARGSSDVRHASAAHGERPGAGKTRLHRAHVGIEDDEVVGWIGCHKDGRSRTSLTSAPTPSISIETRSPGASGATPAGVPVEITSPGSSVITLEM